MRGRLVLGVNVLKEICAIQHNGGVPLSKDQINRCAEIAFVKVQELTSLMDKALQFLPVKKKVVSHALQRENETLSSGKGAEVGSQSEEEETILLNL
ncbi:exosome complex component RRP45-like [Zophobas morio]|uniref:exosome complex component RRP45-like n=1 Tax=Zophobas morio TaxID=2755281 RepID=UPI0030838EBE